MAAVAGVAELLNPGQILLRVIPFQKENPADPAQLPFHLFIPRPNRDNGLLSVYDADLISPQECLNLYNADPNRPQATKVDQLTAEHIREQGLTLVRAQSSNAAHLLIDFRPLDESETYRAAQELREKSQQMGLAYP